MLQANDPFEQYKAKKELERLQKKVKSSASIRCPGEGSDRSASGKLLIDESRSWIY